MQPQPLGGTEEFDELTGSDTASDDDIEHAEERGSDAEAEAALSSEGEEDLEAEEITVSEGDVQNCAQYLRNYDADVRRAHTENYDSDYDSEYDSEYDSDENASYLNGSSIEERNNAPDFGLNDQAFVG